MATTSTTIDAKPVQDKRTRYLIVFFLLTFTITWACWIPVVLSSGGAAQSPIISLLWLLGVFTPALIAIAMTYREQGRAGCHALLGKILDWRVAGRWYLFAMGYMVAIKLGVALAYRALNGAWPARGNELPVVMLFATVLSTPAQAGEELGWRGYALPRLAERFGFAGASLVLGLIWACWHLPQFFLAAADTYHQSFPIWSLEVTAISVAMTWLYLKCKGSLLLMMLMHSAINNTKDIIPSVSAGAKNPFNLHASTVMYLTTLFMWIAAAYFLLQMRRGDTSRNGARKAALQTSRDATSPTSAKSSADPVKNRHTGGTDKWSGPAGIP